LGRKHLVSFALTSTSRLADVEARQAKKSKQTAAPKTMPKRTSTQDKPRRNEESKSTKRKWAPVKQMNRNASNAKLMCFCGEVFSEPWIQCRTCKGWYHEVCTAGDNIHMRKLLMNHIKASMGN
jgi:hypothetical protein